MDNFLNKHYPSSQSKYVLLVGIVVALVAVLKSDKGLASALATIPSVLIQAYIVNCLVTGKCNKIAWFYVALSIVTAGVYFVLL